MVLAQLSSARLVSFSFCIPHKELAVWQPHLHVRIPLHHQKWGYLQWALPQTSSSVISSWISSPIGQLVHAHVYVTLSYHMGKVELQEVNCTVLIYNYIFSRLFLALLLAHHASSLMHTPKPERVIYSASVIFSCCVTGTSVSVQQSSSPPSTHVWGVISPTFDALLYCHPMCAICESTKRVRGSDSASIYYALAAPKPKIKGDERSKVHDWLNSLFMSSIKNSGLSIWNFYVATLLAKA